MDQGIKQFTYPVKDRAQAKKLYSTPLGVEPYDADGNMIGLIQEP